MAEKTWRQIYEEINKAKAEKADAKKKPKALDADQKKARAVESIRRGEGTLEDSIRTKLVDVEDLVKPREVAKADSARSETLINKLITSKAKKEKELADVIDTFDDSGSSTDSLRIKNQIDKIESKLVELTGVGGTDSTSFDASYQKPSTVKKQSWISKMMWGTEEEQEKNAWIDSYIQQDRISAAFVVSWHL